jgi:predicted nucleic acid-binding protein
VIAVDAGFLYALADARDSWHVRSAAQVHTAAEGWITTWPVLTETCHFICSRLDPKFAFTLLDDVAAGELLVWDIPAAAGSEIGRLIKKYASLPMDLADASLVLLAEHLGHGRILSTDMRDFGAYRWKNRKPFKNLLETA